MAYEQSKRTSSNTTTADSTTMATTGTDTRNFSAQVIRQIMQLMQAYGGFVQDANASQNTITVSAVA